MFSISVFEYLDATRRSERNFAERRRAEAQRSVFELKWDTLDGDARLNFHRNVDAEKEPSELKSRYQFLQNQIHYWDKEIERLR